MTALALGLGASLVWGASNFLGLIQGRHNPTAAVLMVSQGAGLLFALVLFAASGDPVPGTAGLGLGVVVGLANAAGLIGMYQAAQTAPLSVVVPINGAGVVFAVLYGVATGDALGPVKATGVALAVGGVVLASRRGGNDSAGSHVSASALAWALFSSIGAGVFLIALKAAAEHGRWWAVAEARGVVLAAVVVWLLAQRSWVRPAPRAAAAFAVPGLLLIAGAVLYTFAADRGLLSIVSVASSLYPVFTVAFAFALLGERLSRVQWIGVAAAVAGTALIAA